MTDFDTAYWDSLYAADPGDNEREESGDTRMKSGPSRRDDHMFSGGPSLNATLEDARGPLRDDSRGQLYFAQLLAIAQQDQLLHVHGLGWHHWDGTRWAEDKGEVHAKRAVIDLLKAEWPNAITDPALRKEIERANTSAGINGILDIAKVLDGIACQVAELDADPWLLNCSNGTLNLRTRQLLDHNPQHRITKITRAAYHPKTRSDEWNMFLERVLPDPEVRAYLARFTGVALIGEVLEQSFTIGTGEGANGKGTFYEAVLNTLGDYGHTMDPEVLIANRHADGNAPKPALVELRGRRLVVTSETEKEVQLANALMKRLTGGDPITARALRRDPITFDPSHSLLMLTNHLPKVPGNDPATWRRIRVIPFDVTIPEADRDPQLGARLRDATDAILTWAVAGLADYQQGGMAPPEAVRVATADYQKRSDALTRFLEERCQRNRYSQTLVAGVWKAWEQWARDDGSGEMSKRELLDELAKRKFPTKAGNYNQKYVVGLMLYAAEDTEAA